MPIDCPPIQFMVSTEFEKQEMTPQEEVTAELRKAWVEGPPLIESARAQGVRTRDEKLAAVTTLGAMKELVDRLVPIRKRQAAPYLRMGKAVQDFYDAILDQLREGIEELKTRYEDRELLERKERERQEAEQRAREEAARQEAERQAKVAAEKAAREAREKAEEEARAAGNLSPAEVQEYGALAAQEAQAAVPAPVKVIPRSAPPAPPKTLKASGGTSGTLKDLVEVRVTDFQAFARWAVESGRYELLEAKLAPVKALYSAGLRTVPGIAFDVRPNLAITGPK